MSHPVNSTLNVFEAQFRATTDLANALLSGAQRIDRALLETAKETMGSQLAYMRALGSVRDLRGAVALRDEFEHPGGERTLSFYREVFDAVSEAVLASTRIFDRYVQDIARGAARENDKSDTTSENFTCLWDAGWQQWNSLAEQWGTAIASRIEPPELKHAKDRPMATRASERKPVASRRRHRTTPYTASSN